MPSALITGIEGQDGSYLAELLLGKGYEVHGLTRNAAPDRLGRLGSVIGDVHLHEGDLLDLESLLEIVRASEPDEVYNLAAMSSVALSWQQAIPTAESTAIGVTRMLEAVRQRAPQARFYQASSSEMFGRAREMPQNELTPFYPLSPYGVAKVYGHFITVNYRESYGLHASSGILFNHDSPRRGMQFVTRQVSHGVASIKLGLTDELVLGNLDVKRDWGFAGDYVQAMWLMLQQETPSDYVVGSGVSHSIRELVDLAFACAELDPDDHVRLEPAKARPADIAEVRADPAKAEEELGWRHGVSFEDLVRMMVESDLETLADQAPTS